MPDENGNPLPGEDAFQAAVDAAVAAKLAESQTPVTEPETPEVTPADTEEVSTSPDAQTEEMHIEEHADETVMDAIAESAEELPQHTNVNGPDFYLGKPDVDPNNPIIHFATEEELAASRKNR